MEKTEIKGRLIEICRNKLLDTISNLEAAMSDAQQQANEYGPPKDRYDSFRTQLIRRRDMMAQQLSKEINELSALDKIDPKKHFNTTGFGAVVLTGDENYFIAVGLGKIELMDQSYYVISPVVPLSQQIVGKKKGDTVEFRGRKIVIADVF